MYDFILENEFVLGDISVFNEYDRMTLESVSIRQIQGSQRLFTVNISFEYYLKMLSSAINTLNSIQFNKDELNALLTINYSVIDSFNLKMKPIIDSNVTTIRPTYLTQYVNNIGVIIDKKIRGELSSEESNRYLSGDVVSKVKRQIVSSTLPQDLTTKELVKYRDNYNDMPVTSDYIRNNIVSFAEKSKSYISTLKSEILSAITEINKSNELLSDYIDAINNYTGELSDIDITKINKFIYNIIRSVLSVVSYMSYMLIRKVNVFHENILSCTMMNDSINNRMGQPFEESVLSTKMFPEDADSLAESLLSGRYDTFENYAVEAYNYYSGAFSVNIEATITSLVYDKSKYDDVNKIYNSISQCINIMSRECDEYVLVSDDIIEASGLSMSLDNRYGRLIDTIDDISHYTSAVSAYTPGEDISDTIFRLLKELYDYPENMKIIADAILDCKTKIEGLRQRFDRNINDEYENTQEVQELIAFLSNFLEDYKGITTKVANKLFLREKSIVAEIETILAKNREVASAEPSCIDVNNSVYESLMFAEESINDSICQLILTEYAIAKAEKTRGVKLVLEAPQQNQQNNNDGNNPPQQPANTQTQSNTNAQQTQNQQQTTTTQDQNKQQQDQNKQQNANSKSKQNVGNTIKEAIAKWFNEIMAKIDELTNSANAKRDAQYFANNKDAILNLHYNNRSYKAGIINYEMTKPYRLMITDASNLARRTSNTNITVEKLKGLNDRDSILKMLFPNNNPPINIFNEGQIAGAVTNFYKNGTYNENKIVFANNDLKKVAEQAIAYCEPFYSKFIPQLKTQFTTIKNNLDEVLPTLIQEGTFDYVLGSLFTEAETNQTNTDKTDVTSMNTKCTVIRQSCEYFCRGLMTAAFARYTDYMALLRSLVNDANTDNQQQQTQEPQPEQK